MCRFSTNPLTGVLTVSPAEKNDRGKYICKAKNAAGEIERQVHLGVVVRPHIDELINISIPAGAQEAHLKCVSSGWPLPQVTFQRIGSNHRCVKSFCGIYVDACNNYLKVRNQFLVIFVLKLKKLLLPTMEIFDFLKTFI